MKIFKLFLKSGMYVLVLAVISISLSCKEESKKVEETVENDEPMVIVDETTGGLALYTVRDAMKENPAETLSKVAAVGYKNIEAAGYENGAFYGMAPTEFKELLEELNLNPVSTHQSSVTLDNADEMIAAAKAAGFRYFVVPIPPMGMFKFDPETRKMSMEGTATALAEILDTLGKKCNDAGLELLYHNHDFELKENADGELILDYLLENCDPSLVNFQMDLYWVTKAGADPLAYFEKYPGRFKAWHVKDMDDQGRFAPVGEGNIDFGRIFAKKDLSGMQHYFVEQDMTFDGLDPLEAIEISKKGVKKIGVK